MSNGIPVPKPRQPAHNGPRPSLPTQVVDALRRAREPIMAAVTRHLEGQARGYAGGSAKPPGRLVRAAVRAAADLYVAEAAGGQPPRTGTDQLFARLGRVEAEERIHLDRMHAAWQVTTRHAWREISRHCHQAGADAGALTVLGELLHELMEELFRYVEAGFLQATRPHDVRARLGRMLLLSPGNDALPSLAAAACWQPPKLAVVAVVEHAARRAAPDLRQLSAALLAWSDTSRTTVILDAARYEELRPALLTAVRPSPIALMGPVALETLGDAHRWSRQALALRRDGVLPADPVVDCAEWLDLLLAASDPPLLNHVTRTALHPLTDLSPHQRYMLALTLYDAIVRGGSAREIAVRLDVHANTVRHRLRQLEGLFGDRMQEPRGRIVLVMALNAVLPGWRDAAKRGANRR